MVGARSVKLPAQRGLTRTRRLAALTVAGVGLPVVTAALTGLRGHVSLASDLLVYLLVVVVVAVTGGLAPAVLTAVAAFVLANWFLTPPYHTLAVESRDEVIALLVFVAVAALVAVTVDLSARRQAVVQHLAAVDEVRSSLLAAVGHDLRTPLAGIKAAASSLRTSDVVLDPQDQADLLATIESGADQLEDLVSNLLSMSRLEAGALSVSAAPVALDEVVARALLTVGRGSEVAMDVDEQVPAVLADPGLLERVVANLVANAVRHSPLPGSVVVRAASDAATVALQVVDHGPGVAPELWGQMFTPFRRLGEAGQRSPATRSDTVVGGVGLGLAIARGFTTAMGGTLTPSATNGGGLTMTVRLPRAEPQAPTPHSARESV